MYTSIFKKEHYSLLINSKCVSSSKRRSRSNYAWCW